MAPCADCTELFCTEVKGADEIECAVRCSCNKVRAERIANRDGGGSVRSFGRRVGL